MFGYITINKPELKVREYNRYRAFYCGLCRTLKREYGLAGELTLTYDMTFLVMLLGALYEPEETLRHARCEVHPLTKQTQITSEATAYGADMNVLLAYYKQCDDWADSHSAVGGGASLILRRKAARAASRYPAQARIIRRELKVLHTLEEQDIRDPEKTARAFGRLLGGIFAWKEDAWSRTLHRIGYYLGMYIYLADAWDDLEEDRAGDHYNPFLGHEPTEESLRRLLRQIMAHAAMAFEYLPVLRDAEILRNILYSGVWMRLGKQEGRRRVCRETV